MHHAGRVFALVKLRPARGDTQWACLNPAPPTHQLDGFDDVGAHRYYYGIGCDLFSKKAIDRLYGVKNRDRKKPFAILCPDLSDVSKYAKVSNFGYRIMRQLTPALLPSCWKRPEWCQT